MDKLPIPVLETPSPCDGSTESVQFDLDPSLTNPLKGLEESITWDNFQRGVIEDHERVQNQSYASKDPLSDDVVDPSVSVSEVEKRTGERELEEVQIMVSSGIGAWNGFHTSVCDRLSASYSELAGLVRPNSIATMSLGTSDGTAIIARPAKFKLKITSPVNEEAPLSMSEFHERSCLLVGLDSHLNTETISRQLREFGNLHRVTLVYHPETGRSIGITLVEFQSDTGCRALLDSARDRVGVDDSYSILQRMFAAVYDEEESRGYTSADQHNSHLLKSRSLSAVAIPTSYNEVLSNFQIDSCTDLHLKSLLLLVENGASKESRRHVRAQWNLTRYGEHFDEYLKLSDLGRRYELKPPMLELSPELPPPVRAPMSTRVSQCTSFVSIDPDAVGIGKLISDSNWLSPKIQSIMNKFISNTLQVLNDPMKVPPSDTTSVDQRNSTVRLLDSLVPSVNGPRPGNRALSRQPGGASSPRASSLYNGYGKRTVSGPYQPQAVPYKPKSRPFTQYRPPAIVVPPHTTQQDQTNTIDQI